MWLSMQDNLLSPRTGIGQNEMWMYEAGEMIMSSHYFQISRISFIYVFLTYLIL